MAWGGGVASIVAWGVGLGSLAAWGAQLCSLAAWGGEVGSLAAGGGWLWSLAAWGGRSRAQPRWYRDIGKPNVLLGPAYIQVYNHCPSSVSPSPLKDFKVEVLPTIYVSLYRLEPLHIPRESPLHGYPALYWHLSNTMSHNTFLFSTRVWSSQAVLAVMPFTV